MWGTARAELSYHCRDDQPPSLLLQSASGEVCPRCARPLPDEEDENEDEGEDGEDGEGEKAEGGGEGDGEGGGEAPDDDAILPKPTQGACPVCRRDAAAPLSEEERSSLVVTMEAVREASPGDEVFNTYGEKSTASLLQMHGFTLESNPHDFVCISGKMVGQALAKQGVAVAAARLETAAEAGLLPEPTLVRPNPAFPSPSFPDIS